MASQAGTLLKTPDSVAAFGGLKENAWVDSPEGTALNWDLRVGMGAWEEGIRGAEFGGVGF